MDDFGTTDHQHAASHLLALNTAGGMAWTTLGYYPVFASVWAFVFATVVLLLPRP